jgi:Ca2+-binding RTX toxin-like protein
VVLGGLGDDLIEGNYGNDTITGGGGNDTFRYEHTLDGHDVISDFDGDAVGGQDVLNLDALFDLLGVANGDRAGRVNLVDNGGTVDIRVNADGGGGNGFELHVATLTTAHEITLGQDIILAA